MKQASLCVEPGCQNTRLYRRYCRYHYQRWALRQAELADPSLIPYSRQPLDQRFWSQVSRDGPVMYPEIGPCWPWIGPASISRGKVAYGRITINGKRVWAHHVAWYLSNGEWPTGEAMQVLHKCDNPPCIRPSHLFVGTHADNMADMVAKGRQAKGPRRFRKASRTTNRPPSG